MNKTSNIEEIAELGEKIKDLIETDTALTEESKFNLMEEINAFLDLVDEAEDDDSDDEEEDPEDGDEDDL